MILDCPKCNARFLVADRLIPPAGRTVKCGSCAHQWHVTPHVHVVEAFSELVAKAEREADEPPLFQDPEPELKPLSHGSNVPAITKRKIPLKPFKIAVPVLLAIWVILAFCTYFPRWVNAPGLSAIYGIFGVSRTDGLVFADVNMEREEGETKTKFIFSGSIVNQSSEARMVPTVHITLKDKDGEAVWGRDYPVNVELKAGEVYPFRIVNVETSFAASVHTIVLDMGNSLELMVR